MKWDYRTKYNYLFVCSFFIRSGDVRFYGIITMLNNTYPGPIAVINVTFDIWFHWAQISLPIEFDECNQSSKYEMHRGSWCVNFISDIWPICFLYIFRSESPDDLDASLQKNNDSHVSGISPFFSSEDMNVSLNNTPIYCESVSTKWQQQKKIPTQSSSCYSIFGRRWWFIAFIVLLRLI